MGFMKWFRKSGNTKNEIGEQDKGQDKKKKYTPSLDGMKEERLEGYAPAITDECLALLVGWKAAAGANELSFIFRLDSGASVEFPDGTLSTGVIDYVNLGEDEKAGPGFVENSALSVLRQEMNSNVAANGQGHTHPRGMGAFWSGTDRMDQDRDVRFISQMIPQGERYFVVFGGSPALKFRRFRWNTEKGERVYFYGDTFVRNSQGIPLNNQPVYEYRTPLKKGSKKGVEGYSKGIVVIPGIDVGDLEGYHETFTPEQSLEKMKADEFQWLKMAYGEDGDLVNHLLDEYGERILHLPSDLGDESMALLEAINIVVNLTGDDYHDVLQNPDSWGHILSGGSSRWI